MRDIADYANKYTEPGFEEYKVFYRRKKLMEIIEAYQPKRILEIGCGSEPLFQYVENVEFTVIEPSQIFYNHALELARKNEKVTCINGFFEDITSELDHRYDMIICASLLHEVEQPDKLLDKIATLCNKDTVVHINVPNANSMHRLLGKEMGILANVHDKSENNKAFQQNNVFDIESLHNIVLKKGFEVIESGSYFLKPFSHAQMYEIIQKEILDEKVLEGLYQLGKHMPDFGSEIYVNCKLKTVK